MDKLGVAEEALSDKERKLLSEYDETREYWSIIGEGCSWYCGGFPKSIKASSSLKGQGSINYKAQNAHDLNYKNVWAEGVPGYGIGEYLVYTFESSFPRITQIIVANGYVKSASAWENNSRVKKLKVYINDKPYAILNLKDSRSEQTFNAPPIGNGIWNNKERSTTNGADWTMKFEIMEVYKGKKYDDVVLSEIYFDGIDVHCLAKGTPILMADGSSKSIEHLKIGDAIAYKDANSQTLKEARIEKLEQAKHHQLVTYKFASGREITTTQDHPFMLQGKGWASMNPEKSKNYKGFNNISKIAIGDFFLTTDGVDKLIVIESVREAQETYTISRTNQGDHFIANGLLVAIEELND